VFLNGVKLTTSEYTATNGTSVVLGTAAALNDIVEIIAWAILGVSNTAIGNGTGTSLILSSASANILAAGPAGTTNPTINVDASTASAATGLNIKGAAAAGGLAVSVLSSGTNENLTIDAKGSGTVTLNATGTGSVLVNRLLDISASTAGQIKFPATQNASANANTLDDYEEGTWTPIDTSGASLSYTSNSGRYTKIGNRVLASGTYTYPSTANATVNKSGGLPFSVLSGEGTRAGYIGYTDSAAIYLLHDPGNTNFVVFTASSSPTNATLSTKDLYVGFNYTTS
jgi:hypothetical protein